MHSGSMTVSRTTKPAQRPTAPASLHALFWRQSRLLTPVTLLASSTNPQYEALPHTEQSICIHMALSTGLGEVVKTRGMT